MKIIIIGKMIATTMMIMGVEGDEKERENDKNRIDNEKHMHRRQNKGKLKIKRHMLAHEH